MTRPVKTLTLFALSIAVAACGLFSDVFGASYNHDHDCQIVQTTDDWATTKLDLYHDDARSCPRMAQYFGGPLLEVGALVSTGGLAVQDLYGTSGIDTANTLVLSMHHTSYVCQEQVLDTVFAEEQEDFIPDYWVASVSHLVYGAGIWMEIENGAAYPYGNYNIDCAQFRVHLRHQESAPAVVVRVRYRPGDV